MLDICGSVNVSEILGTLTETQKGILNEQALRIIRNDIKPNLTAYMAFVYMCRDELTPIQQSAVKALLEEVRKRREELLNELMQAVEDAMLKGTDFCQKVGRIDNAERYGFLSEGRED